MAWSWFSCEAILATVLGFASRAVASAAACIGCFCCRDSPYRILPAPDGEVTEIQNDIFVSDGKMLRGEEEQWNLLFDGFDVGELKEQAKFLKACGTIPETPVEIRKAVSDENVEGKSSGFKLWLPKKLNLEKEAEERADSSVETPTSPNSCLIEGYSPGSGSENSIESFRDQSIMTPTDTHESGAPCSEASPVSPKALHSSLQCRQKTVRFDFEPDVSMFSSAGLSSDSSDQQSDRTVSTGYKSASPYPTPLKLSDEMQTPGTIFPGYLNNGTDGKTARIRSQYVYSVLNPVEYPFHWKKLNCEASGFASLQDIKHEVSFTSLAEPTSADRDGYIEQLGSNSNENVYGAKTPANSSDENSHISSKWWGDNGIPNTTTKYKEDQKVRWHETPFEKRLEKALSAILERKEEEENDNELVSVT